MEKMSWDLEKCEMDREFSLAKIQKKEIVGTQENSIEEKEFECKRIQERKTERGEREREERRGEERERKREREGFEKK